MRSTRNEFPKTTIRRTIVALAIALAAAACDDAPPLAPASTAVADLATADVHGADAELHVLTRNLYVGAPIEALFDPTLEAAEIPGVAAELWAAIRATDFPARAEALAAEIERHRPHLVGLQEVSVFKLQLVSDLVVGGTTPAADVQLDFLAELLAALDERGLGYAPVATSRNFAAEVPILNPASPVGLSDIRLEDFDVVLARSDVTWERPRSANFTARPVFELGGATVELPRGWAAVDATVGGRTVTFVNTHLEPAETAGGAVQVAQAEELVAALADNPHPVVLVGDLNSEADGGSTPTYELLLGQGYRDAWTRASDGHTCCHAEDLRNERVELTKRIDFVLVRGELGTGPGGLRGAVRAEVVGARIPDRTPSGLWPSDHAGVAAVFRIRPDGGNGRP